jgi:hypothetical protein
MKASLAAAALLAVSLAFALGALRCLADRLLMSTLLYAVAAAAAAGGAAKIAIDAL